MWQFVQLSDPHLGSLVDGQWNNRVICTMMPEVISCLRRDLGRLQPDFLLVTGDIASQHTRDAVFAARDLLDSLGVPYYPMGGNHDFVSEESRAWFVDAFRAYLPNEDTVYSFTHKGLHFCVLDAWWKWRDDSLRPFGDKGVAETQDVSVQGSRWALPAHQIAWLEEDLAQHATLPTIVASHFPLISIPKRIRRPGLRDAGHLQNGAMVLELLHRHPQVKAVLSGHLHFHFIERVGNLPQVVTGSMPEFPCEYRVFQVHEDRMEIATRALSDASFANRSLIPGKEWAAGEPQDRVASIPL